MRDRANLDTNFPFHSTDCTSHFRNVPATILRCTMISPVNKYLINVFSATMMFPPLRASLWSSPRSCYLALLSPNLCRSQTRWSRTIQRLNTHNNGGYSGWSKTGPWIFYPTCAVIFGAACFVTYQTSQPFRHSILALVRCTRVAGICLILSYGH